GIARMSLELADQDKKALVLRAPREGVIVGLPNVDEVGKRWDKEQGAPFCSIGNPKELRVYVALPPSDFDLVKENLKKLGGKGLSATIRVQGRTTETWKGEVISLPPAEAKEIPRPLSNRGGGPVAVNPKSDANHMTPLSQVFLVGVNFLKPDEAIAPGNLAQVKIHCEYRSAAWWAWRTISSTFDLGLSF